MEVSQYQVVIVNLDPTIGNEIKKTRPCVIISPDEMNHNLSTLVIAPITSGKRNYPTRIKVKLEGREGRVVLDQIRTIDKKRIVKVGKRLNTKLTLEIKSLIRKIYVD